MGAQERGRISFSTVIAPVGVFPHTNLMNAPRPFTYDPPTEPWLTVLHEDDDILVLSKPSGLLTVPGKEAHLADCLEARAVKRWGAARIVHRLDKDTSGVMVLGRHDKAQRHLGKQFQSRRVEKTYIARVAGHVNGDSGEVDLPIATDPERRPMQMIDHENGRAAITRWEVIARETLEREEGAMPVTRLRLTPITGRSHQLRLHLAFLGHPILGDAFYSDDDIFAAAPRLQLHAETLVLRHPNGGARVSFTDPTPF